MAVFNYLRKEIDAKIVYYGPGISGKTTNLQHIHQHLKPEQRGRMVSLATDEDRTLFFDFLPIELASVRGFRTRFHLYTVPGQVYYGATRRAVLTGVDGVIFVADSQADRLEDNLLSLKDLEENLRYYGKKIETVPLIFQYNKRDLPNVLAVEELDQKINRLHVPHFESVAVLGQGVFEALTLACRMVLRVVETGVEARRSAVSESVLQPAAAAALRIEKTELGRVPPGVRQEKETAAVLEKRLSPRVFKPPEPEPEHEAKRNNRTLLGRMFDKKRLPPHPIPPPRRGDGKGEGDAPAAPGNNGAEEKETAARKLRILSCGEARVLEPASLEIPLTVEVDESGKKLSLSVQVSIQLNHAAPKVDV